MNFYNRYTRILDEYKRSGVQEAKHRLITMKNKTMYDCKIVVSPRCTVDMFRDKYHISMIAEVIIIDNTCHTHDHHKKSHNSDLIIKYQFVPLGKVKTANIFKGFDLAFYKWWNEMHV